MCIVVVTNVCIGLHIYIVVSSIVALVGHSPIIVVILIIVVVVTVTATPIVNLIAIISHFADLRFSYIIFGVLAIVAILSPKFDMLVRTSLCFCACSFL